MSLIISFLKLLPNIPRTKEVIDHASGGCLVGVDVVVVGGGGGESGGDDDSDDDDDDDMMIMMMMMMVVVVVVMMMMFMKFSVAIFIDMYYSFHCTLCYLYKWRLN